ncbi:MAG: DUF2891 domain-containing protein [Candidatus Eisenbacteria bacterium]|uniref:DUF2891 domain-containing protein n=1 Tax=Eiseniibacteriota bacterium TaxID=2212470 RepID=A0A538U350_UNCEI|nr:MAG: DUF2891 domain-containing protein [Candidatus Eisenbacteria bacterium]
MSVVARAAPSAASLVELILAAVGREYPSHIVHWMRSDEDARPPRELTPAFFGSFDWHSCVHGHWALARLARLNPGAPFEARARAALATSLTPAKIAGEAAYLGIPERAGFERPYGLAWLLQLAAELREWADAEAAEWSAALAPLEALARDRVFAWLPKLPWPVRSGVHAQTALSLCLILDWSRVVKDHELEALIARRARAWFESDLDAPIAYEPSGNDFLSPALGEADLMRRVCPAMEFAGWLAAFLPDLESDRARRWLTPVTSPDPSDGQLAHLDGLNLSRAWMLEGIASALAPAERRRALLEAAAREHAAAGLSAVSGEHYAGAHWLGSYAVYLMTRRGIA